MKGDESSLEKDAKEFYRMRINLDPSNKGFNPIEINDLYKHIDKINYLIAKRYLYLGSKIPEQEISESRISPSSASYKRTPEGDEWAES
ncbi:MAG: hypothetical protein ACP5NZ_03235 [Nanobdellota archaeon]